MADVVSATGRQEPVEEVAVAEEIVSAAPVTTPAAIPASTALSAPLPPIEAADTRPVMLPRAMHPFGWSRRDLRRFLGLGFTAIVALLFLWQVQSILPPFLIAFFLAALLDPTLRYMEQHGHSRVRAILTIYLLGLLLVVLFAIAVVPAVSVQIAEVSKNLGLYYNSIQQSIDTYLRAHASQLDRMGIHKHTLNEMLNQRGGPVQDKITAALGGVSTFLSTAFSKVLWLIIIPISAFFFMRDYTVLRARIIALFPEAYQDQIDVMSREIADVFSAYLRGLAKICSLYALTAFLLFSALGLKYALFLGLAAGVFYAVPYVGQLFTAIGTGSVAYFMEKHTVLFLFHVDTHSVTYTVTVIVCAIVVQNIFDQILYPRVVGGSVGLHPVISIFALMAGATLFGVWGMLVAVPVAASLQIILTYFFPKLRQPPPARLLETPPPLA